MRLIRDLIHIRSGRGHITCECAVVNANTAIAAAPTATTTISRNISRHIDISAFNPNGAARAASCAGGGSLLDGGRVLRSALWIWKKDIRWATGIAAQIGSGFGLLLTIMGIVYIVSGNFVGGLWWILIGLFLRSTAQMSYQQLLARNLFNAKKLNELMVKNPVTVPRSISLEEFVRDYVYKHHFQMYPVLSFGKLTGCISIKQVASIPREEWAASTVGAVALPCNEETTVGPEEDANKALAIMNRTGNSRLLVVKGDQLEGIIALKDMLNLLSLKIELNDLEK